jgi:tryptophan synthase alpha chain
VPLIAMSYANHAYQRGITRYCEELAGAGFSGTIIPDLPVGEADEYLAAAAGAGLDATLMVTPATPPDQMRAIARRSRGFLYVMSVMATTGSTNERDDERRWALAARALGVAADRSAADRSAAQRPAAEQCAAEPCATGPGSPPPVLIGFGIDTPARAAAAARHADGVIVASALMRRVLDGADADDIARAVGDLRAAIDTARSAA